MLSMCQCLRVRHTLPGVKPASLTAALKPWCLRVCCVGDQHTHEFQKSIPPHRKILHLKESAAEGAEDFPGQSDFGADQVRSGKFAGLFADDGSASTVGWGMFRSFQLAIRFSSMAIYQTQWPLPVQMSCQGCSDSATATTPVAYAESSASDLNGELSVPFENSRRWYSSC